MQVISEIAQLRQNINATRVAGNRIGFVPTMGNLHAGHIKLIEAAQENCDACVVSIFVNPLQFDEQKDFTSYPRTIASDQQILEGLGVDTLFLPTAEALYPKGLEHTSKIIVPEINTILCGQFRPGHFDGVTTVVAKLFNIIMPDIAVFGKKDYQQLLLVQRLIEDLNFTIQLIGVETARDEDGLALSSRNSYLTPEERKSAPALYQALLNVKNAVLQGSRDYAELQQRAHGALSAAGLDTEYFEILDASDLSRPNATTRKRVVLAAARLGSARLIDNIEIDA